MCFVRVRHPEGEELTINLIELEDALQGGPPGDYYLLPKSGRIILMSSEEMDDESEDAVVPDDEDALPTDVIESMGNLPFGYRLLRRFPRLSNSY